MELGAGLGTPGLRVLIQPLPLTRCATLGKSINVSGFVSSSVQMRIMITNLHHWLLGEYFPRATGIHCGKRQG